MKRVDKDPSRYKPGLVDHGYRVPEPALLITGQSSERRKLFMTNWLAVRHLWISRLDHNPPHRFPSPQLWHEFLHSIPSLEGVRTPRPSQVVGKKMTTAKDRKLLALEIFEEEAAALTQGASWAPKEVVEWRDQVLPITSLANPPVRIIRAILWELYEIRFRYELCALDQVVVPHLWDNHSRVRPSLLECVFPATSGLLMWSEPLPLKSGDLGFSDSFANNMRVLQSFCLLISAWPGADPTFSSFPVAMQSDKNTWHVSAHEVSSRACLFYVQTFFDHFGRPPLVPHAFPFEYHQSDV